MSGLGKAIGGIFGATRSGQGSIPITPARQISTEGLQLDVRRGFLTRSGPQRERVIVEEDKAFDNLARNRADVLGLRSQLAAPRAALGPLQEEGRGLFGRTDPLFDRLGTQLNELRPGFGRLTAARVGAVRNAASKAIGNVRSAFQQRDILGSNFAQREIASIGNEFGRQEAEERATAFVEEQQAQRDIIDQISQLVGQDVASISANVGLLGAELGLTQAEAGILSEEVANISQQAAVIAQRVQRELGEFALATSAITGLTGLAANIGAVNAGIAANNAANRGAGIATAFQGVSSFFNVKPIDVNLKEFF